MAAPVHTPEYEKECVVCGETYYRKYYPNRWVWESLCHWRVRKYCSSRCAGKAPRTKKPEPGPYSRYRLHLKTSCEACGETNDLQVHHIDADRSNNRKENLQTLCSLCHMFWHRTMRKRKWAYHRMPSLITEELEKETLF